MARYEVICGNIGTVYDGNNPVEARRIYGIYKEQSETGYGRAGGESVTIMEDGEPTTSGKSIRTPPSIVTSAGKSLTRTAKATPAAPSVIRLAPAATMAAGRARTPPSEARENNHAVRWSQDG
jgi:hypothetical protein